MFMKGFTYGFDAKRGMLMTEKAEKSMISMTELGGDYVALTVCIRQDNFYSTTFGFDFRTSVTDKEVAYTIKKLKNLGLKVCLKPMINCSDGVWRALINFPENQGFGKEYWSEWFECYNAFLCHYAEIATDNDVDLFCLGCEMKGTEQQIPHWRKTIANVKEIYKGPLVYNTNHGGESNVEWFDELDYIGTSAYYPVAEKGGASVDEMVKAWEEHKAHLKSASEKFGGKKIIFMEIGCRSAEGCATMPWDFTHKEYPYSEEEQANFYESSILAMKDEEWFGGFFWWDWSTYLPENIKNDGFAIYGKKAETVLKKYYKM